MPEEHTMSKTVLAERIKSLRAQRNHTISMRNKVENLYRYAKVHSDILPTAYQLKVTDDNYGFDYVAKILTERIKNMAGEIAKLTNQLKQIN